MTIKHIKVTIPRMNGDPAQTITVKVTKVESPPQVITVAVTPVTGPHQGYLNPPGHDSAPEADRGEP